MCAILIVIIIRRNRVKTNYHFTPEGAWVRMWLRTWVRTWMHGSQFILGTAPHIFLKFCTKLEETKKENFAQGPIFDKKWLKITILISAYRRTSSTAACFITNFRQNVATKKRRIS